MMHLPKNTRWLLLCPLMLTLTATAQAGPRDHIGGFFLRLSGGIGAASSKIDAPLFGETKLSGMTGDINLAIGGGIANNLMLHGTIWGWAVSNPDLEIDGNKVETNGDFGLSAFGGGVTYYIMPANVYLSGSVGTGVLTLDDSKTDYGLVLDATIGKEWWVGNKWGLGVAVGGNYHSVADGGVDANWSGFGFAVRFSATLN